MDLNTIFSTAMNNAIELAVRDQLTPYILRIQALEDLLEASPLKDGGYRNSIEDAVCNYMDRNPFDFSKIEDDVDERIADFLKNNVTISFDTY